MITFGNEKLQFEENKRKIYEYTNIIFKHGLTFDCPYTKILIDFIKNLYNNANVQLTSSGTAALHAALLSLEIPKNSRILIPTMTYSATAQAVVGIGCIPTFVDVDESWLLNFKHLEDIYKLYSKEISAVIVVDLYGLGCDINKLHSWCKSKKLKLIIDAAQSFGLTNESYDQTIADAICLSFNHHKNFNGIGGGGAVVSKYIDATNLNARCIVGKTISGPEGKINYHGLNLRITAIQTALIAANIDLYENRKYKKTQIVKKYIESFKNFEDKLKFPKESFYNNYNWYVFPISPVNYENVVQNLDKNLISYGHHYKFPLHKEKLFAKYNNHSCPYAESLANKIISIPSHTHLSDTDVNFIIQTVISAL
jgi:dTDP-4-amino-4,6-dideoxygalactose transaminase